MLSVIMLNVGMLSVIPSFLWLDLAKISTVMLSVVFFYCYAECNYAKWHYAKCHYAECRGTKRHNYRKYKA
jgi:hypothetical protein